MWKNCITHQIYPFVNDILKNDKNISELLQQQVKKQQLTKKEI